MIAQKDVTIIIPHLGAHKEQCYALTQCIASLKESGFTGDILVIKNGLLPCTCPRSMRILSQGQCKAVNAAVATTNTPWVLISNDDMIYAPGWFDDLNLCIRDSGGFELESSNIQCMSPMLIEPRPGAPTFETFFCGGAGGDFDKQKWLNFVADYRGGQELSLRTGFNLPLLIMRELWDTVGGYDINFDPWGSNSDSDLEYKIRLAGVQPYQNQNCIVYHFSQTSGTFEPKHQDAWSKNWDYFIKKWGFARTDKGIWEANFEMPTPKDGRIFEPWWEDMYA